MVSAIVEAEGYEAVAVADGQQALEVLRQDAQFSAAIFDMMMPHLLGLDLIVFMKADERLRDIPVGMISAEQDPKIWDDSVTAGASVHSASGADDAAYTGEQNPVDWMKYRSQLAES